MADVSLKEQKLAAARKKLRKYQKRKGNGTDKSSKSGETSPYLEVLKSEISSSRSSSVTDISETGCNDLDLSEQNAKAVSLGNSVNNGLNDSNMITSSFEVPYDQSSISNASIIESAQTGPVDSLNSHLLSHQIDDKRPTDKYSHSGILYEENTKTGSETLSNPLNKIDSLENDGSVCSETNASITTVVHVKKDSNMLQNAQDIPIRSTTESLRQLSLQMSGLVNEAEMHDPNQQERTILELEKRNNELASFLETEKQKSAQQTCIIEEMGRTIESQNAQLQGFQKMPVADSNGMEVNGLREQLQVHIQTIGILVSEKSELQSSVSHHRYALEQKNGEVTELQGRLDASREHVKNLEASLHELEAQLSTVSGSKENDSQQLIHLQENYSKLSKLCDEMRASTAELTERLAVRTEENQKLGAELSDVRRHYELAQVHLEQLRDNSTEDTRKRYEELEKSFSESQHQIQLSFTALEQVQSEKKQLEQEYKMYTSQLMSETEELKQKLTKECEKCEALEASNAKLSQDVIAKEAGSKALHTLAAVKAERDQLTNSLSQVTEANSQLEDKCTSLTRDNGHLSQLLVEQSTKLELLEAAADRTSTQEVDTSQLLQSMQSDKVAAARALSQNKQLKEQLEELQNGFIMMSNKKLELTEKLEKELHLKKNLYKEISQLGEELNSHKQGILAKQREIEVLKGGRPLPQSPSGHLNGHGHQHGDHNHHHVNHGHQHGDHDHHHTHDHHHDNHHNHDHHHGHEDGKPVQKIDSMVNSGSEEISSIEASVEMGVEPVCVEDAKERQSLIPNVCHDDHNQDHVSLRVAYDALEKRFLKCMKDLAAVSNEKQDLEHVVEQLQLETETIGDYITIYQFQRGVMKQQMQDLNCEMDLMRTEKQAITSNLSKLQKLVESLVANKSEIKAGFIEGLHSIINDTVKDSEKTKVDLDAEKESALLENGTTVAMETGSPPEETSVKKTNTVKQIIDLISEMETSSQLDLSSLHKFHPCPHCSGKLITI